MKYLIVDDDAELYKQMYHDLFLDENIKKYNIEEIERMRIPRILMPIYRLHFNQRINFRIFLPFKGIWTSCYQLHKYRFDSNEKYCIIFLNGTLREHFSKKYLEKLKREHENINLVMILYDSFSNPNAKRAIDMIPIFDTVFSFDKIDCEKNGFEYIYSTFSKPDFVKKDSNYYSSAFFVGFAQGRLEMLKNTFKIITKKIKNCKFIIAGVHENEKENIKDVIYNKTISYKEELQYAYNTDCIVEIIRDGQTGVSLRTCEAICFNKKLLTNNIKIKEMPFYDERYIQVFEDVEKINLDFLENDIVVKYDKNDFFSPINIVKRLNEIYSE